MQQTRLQVDVTSLATVMGQSSRSLCSCPQARWEVDSNMTSWGGERRSERPKDTSSRSCHVHLLHQTDHDGRQVMGPGGCWAAARATQVTARQSHLCLRCVERTHRGASPPAPREGRPGTVTTLCTQPPQCPTPRPMASPLRLTGGL